MRPVADIMKQDGVSFHEAKRRQQADPSEQMRTGMTLRDAIAIAVIAALAAERETPSKAADCAAQYADAWLRRRSYE